MIVNMNSITKFFLDVSKMTKKLPENNEAGTEYKVVIRYLIHVLSTAT